MELPTATRALSGAFRHAAFWLPLSWPGTMAPFVVEMIAVFWLAGTTTTDWITVDVIVTAGSVVPFDLVADNLVPKQAEVNPARC